MKLGSIRELAGLKPVLQDPNSSGPDPVYWVFADSTDGKWANVTVIVPGKIGQEFPKTYGHYHPENAVTETYHLINGEGVLVMQKKDLSEVLLIKVKPGEEVQITPEWGHSWSNIGPEPLISFDDWKSGHTPADYQPMEEKHGLAYYLVEEAGEVKALPNPNYMSLPQPKWITAEEFKHRQSVTSTLD